MGRLLFEVARAVAAFFGVFALSNAVRDFVSDSAADLNVWWIGVQWLPTTLTKAILIAAGLLLIAFACRPALAPWRLRLTSALLAILIVFAIADSAMFWSLELSGRIRPGIPMPLSLLVALSLALVLWSAWTTRIASRKADLACRPRAIVVVLGMLMISFPVAQMFLFGKTDYRRRADCAVVFGARAYADGRPSDALADRVRTACRLYQDGLVKVLVFSGGPGDGDVHEAESMRRMANGIGVPDSSIILDRKGINTRATVEQTSDIFKRLGARRIIAVSHFYHLPRVKLAYQQAGIEVYTVPARETYVLSKMPLLMAREVAAWWAYWIA